MANIQAVLAGLDAAPLDTSIDAFRDSLRNRIFSLPTSNPHWQPTWRLMDPITLNELQQRAVGIQERFPVDYDKFRIDRTDRLRSNNSIGEVIEISDN